MKVRKIFSPDLMFSNHIKSCWVDNIETMGSKLPINEDLKEEGIFALDIKPQDNKDYWIFGLPVNKDWSPADITSNLVEFSIVTSEPFNLKIQLNNDKDKVIWEAEEKINNVDAWKQYQVKLSGKYSKAKLLLFTGPSSIVECLMKNIVIK